MWRKLLPYLSPARWQIVAGVLVLFAGAALELLLPWPVKWLVDFVLGPHQPPEWLTALWPFGEGRDKTAALAGICAVTIFLAVLHRAAVFISQSLLIAAGGRLVMELRSRGCEQFCRLSLSYHDQTRVGDSLYRLAYDTQAGMTLISGAIVPLLQAGVTLAGILIVMLRMDWMLTLVAVALAPAFWVCIKMFSPRIDRRSQDYHENEGALLSTIQEALSSMRTIQAFTREPDTSLRFSGLARDSFRHQLRLVRLQLAFSGAVGLLMAAGSACAIWLGARQAMAGQLSAGDILVFLAYMGMLYQPFNALTQGASAIQSSKSQLRRVFEVLDASPGVKDRPGAQALSHVKGEVEFRNLSFSYSPDVPVLKSVNFRAFPGEVIAIVGPTGTGKSTLASLLMRFYDPTGGSILLDGNDLRDLTLSSLRRNVSVVLQDALLLSGSVRENIAYGRPTASHGEIERAARRAQAHDFIVSLPQGYETNLAERATNLSGGQKQRLAIARAFLKDSPLLLLDEPTAALDPETESALLEGLGKLIIGRTTFIIAHRFSTIRLASRVIVLRGGEIVATGTHPELLDTSPFYRQLFEAGGREDHVN